VEPFDPYVRLLVDEARRRGIKATPIPEMSQGYAVLELGEHREFVCQAMSNGTGTVSFRLAHNKAASLRLLSEAGLPVGAFVVTASVDEALAFAADHEAVVAKPVDRSFGVGVRVGLATDAQVRRGFAEAQQQTRVSGKRVMVQEQLPGVDCRVLVVGRSRCFGVERVPAHLFGDGETPIGRWIEAWNETLPMRNRRIQLTQRLSRQLEKQGWDLDGVPGVGVRVELGELANTHQGGFCTDITDALCPEAREAALASARYFGADFLGVDFVSPDIRSTPGRIIELNPHAGITLHHQPTFGAPQDVAGAILDQLFPETSS